jgi:hypothetical protein
VYHVLNADGKLGTGITLAICLGVQKYPVSKPDESSLVIVLLVCLIVSYNFSKLDFSFWLIHRCF